MPIHTGGSYPFQDTIKSLEALLTKSQTYRLLIIYYISTEMLFAAIKRCLDLMEKLSQNLYYKP